MTGRFSCFDGNGAAASKSCAGRRPVAARAGRAHAHAPRGRSRPGYGWARPRGRAFRVGVGLQPVRRPLDAHRADDATSRSPRGDLAGRWARARRRWCRRRLGGDLRPRHASLKPRCRAIVGLATPHRLHPPRRAGAAGGRAGRPGDGRARGPLVRPTHRHLGLHGAAGPGASLPHCDAASR